jgi:hypothetical protein
MDMSRALAIAGENITAATNNNSTNVRRKYLDAARAALKSVDAANLPPSKKGVHSMLEQKLQAADPVSCPQFSSLAGWSGLGAIPGPPLLGDKKWRYGLASVLLGSTAMFFLGQPTLLDKALSSNLEIELWDTSEVVRNNLIAMAAVLGALVLWKRLAS